jgi:hypothetical protein
MYALTEFQDDESLGSVRSTRGQGEVTVEGRDIIISDERLGNTTNIQEPVVQKHHAIDHQVKWVNRNPAFAM